LVREGKRVAIGDGEPLLEALEGLRPLEAVVETCPFWPWIHDTLEPTEIGFHLAHASKVEAVGKSDVKTDDIDARMLARLLSVGLVRCRPKGAIRLRGRGFHRSGFTGSGRCAPSTATLHLVTPRAGARVPPVPGFGNAGTVGVLRRSEQGRLNPWVCPRGMTRERRRSRLVGIRSTRMHKRIEGVIEADGTVRLREPVEGGRVRRDLVTVLDEDPEDEGGEFAPLTEGALSDWLLGEEEEAWRELKPVR